MSEFIEYLGGVYMLGNTFIDDGYFQADLPECTKTKEDTAIAATNVGDFPMDPPPHIAPT